MTVHQPAPSDPTPLHPNFPRCLLLIPPALLVVLALEMASPSPYFGAAVDPVAVIGLFAAMVFLADSNSKRILQAQPWFYILSYGDSHRVYAFAAVWCELGLVGRRGGRSVRV